MGSLVIGFSSEHIFEIRCVAVIETLVDAQKYVRHQANRKNVPPLGEANFRYFIRANITAGTEIQENLLGPAHVAAR